MLGLYVRLSEETDGLGLKRQEQDCRQLTRKPVRLYCDPDNSAYKKVKRPAFEAMLTDLEAGLLDGIVAYDLDRLARRPSDLERIIDLYDQRSLTFATVQGEVDLSSADGRTMARVLVAFANKSSMDTSRRVKRKHLELAQKGVPVGGHRPFGYKADKKTPDPSEAKLVVQAAQDILQGVGLHTIVRQWNSQGIKTTAGNPWRKQVLRHMFLSPRLSGYRVYRGKMAMDTEGKPVRGLYPAILEVEVWEAVCAVLTDPSRSGPHVHPGGRKYLLSGIVRCATCSQTLVGNADNRWNTFSYLCKNNQCPRTVGVNGPKVDSLIEQLLLAYLAERELPEPSEVWGREAELADLLSRISDLMSAYSSGQLSSEVVFPQVAKIESRVLELRGEHSTWLREQVRVTQPSNVHEAWPTLDTEQRRSVIASVLQSVVIKPASVRSNRFDPERVEVVWR